MQNTAYGRPEHLPFDLRPRKILKYRLQASDDPDRDKQKRLLKSQLVEALSLVLRIAQVTATAQQRAREEAKNQLEAEGKLAMRGLEHGFLHPFLAWYYNVELWTHNGQAFPAVVFSLPTPEKVTPNGDVLGPWDCTKARASLKEDWALLDREYVEVRKRAGRDITNRQTFCLHKLLFRDNVPIVDSNLVGYYEDCLATCDALERELLAAFSSNPPKSSDPKEFARFSESSLPLRQAAKSFCEKRGFSPHLSGAGTSAAIAVATFTVAKIMDGSYVTFLGHRSAKTAAHPDLLHVAPSGMLQPIWDWQTPTNAMDEAYYKAEWSLRNHVLREVAEELFSRNVDKELADNPPETPYVILGYPEVKFLNELIASGGAELFVTGVLVNLLNLRTEIATVLMIHDPRWYQHHSQGTHGLPKFARNWEFLSNEQLKAQDLPKVWHFPLWTPGEGDRSHHLLARIGGVTPTRFVVPGAVTLLLGIQFARTTFETKR